MGQEESAARLERLFRSSFRRVMAYCLRRTSENAAADAVSEVYAVAWRGRRRIPSDDQEAVLWLLGIARGVLANQARGQRRWARLLSRVAAHADLSPRHDRYDEGDEVGSAMAELSPADQEVLRLAYWDDLSRREIATVLGVAPGTVDTRLHRARERLRQRLARTDSDAVTASTRTCGTREESDVAR